MVPARWLRLGVAACALTALALLFPVAGGQEPKPTDKKPINPGAVEVKFTDNSTLKMTLLDEKIDFVTPYGKLSIPVADIQTLDFATRVSEDAQKKVEKAIADLGSTDFKTREAATAELLKLGEKAYPAVVDAAKSSDVEVKRRAEAILEKIKAGVPPEMLKVRKVDTLTTEGAKFVGRIEVGTIRVNTNVFGEQQVKLADIRSLRSLAVKPAANPAVRIETDPNVVGANANQFGKVLYVRMTGVNNGALWGTDLYTTDSTPGMAAVHAGVLKVGETGVVKVTIVVPPPNFEGTTRNGITSSPYGQYPGAYTVEPANLDNE
jgi:hypothetical protein